MMRMIIISSANILDWSTHLTQRGEKEKNGQELFR